MLSSKSHNSGANKCTHSVDVVNTTHRTINEAIRMYTVQGCSYRLSLSGIALTAVTNRLNGNDGYSIGPSRITHRGLLKGACDCT